MNIIETIKSFLSKDKQTPPSKCSFCDAEAVGLSMRYINTTDKVFTYYCKEHQPKEGIST